MTLGVGYQFALHPPPTPRVQMGCGANFFPYTQNVRKHPLKIRHLHALGVGGVEGAVRKIFSLSYIYMRVHARERGNDETGWRIAAVAQEEMRENAGAGLISGGNA